MRCAFVAAAVLLVATLVKPADACFIVTVGKEGRPTRDVARLIGVVTGYRAGAGFVRNVPNPPGLRVRVDAVISGALLPGEVQVYPLSLGADCSIGPIGLTDLERQFPVSTRVFVQGQTLAWSDAPGRPVVAVDPTRYSFVLVVPAEADRTPDGDLDFERTGSSPYSQFTRFEFDRVVLTLSDSPPRQRRARLRNLAFYRGFWFVPEARTLYRDLLTEAGLPQSQQTELLELFDALMRQAR